MALANWRFPWVQRQTLAGKTFLASWVAIFGVRWRFSLCLDVLRDTDTCLLHHRSSKLTSPALSPPFPALPPPFPSLVSPSSPTFRRRFRWSLTPTITCWSGRVSTGRSQSAGGRWRGMVRFLSSALSLPFSREPLHPVFSNSTDTFHARRTRRQGNCPVRPVLHRPSLVSLVLTLPSSQLRNRHARLEGRLRRQAPCYARVSQCCRRNYSIASSSGRGREECGVAGVGAWEA
jgi:hypothetical protein